MTPTAAATTDGLLVQHLQKTYVGRQVVQDVSISVSKGEVVGLLGPNGAGKTTSFSVSYTHLTLPTNREV